MAEKFNARPKSRAQRPRSYPNRAPRRRQADIPCGRRFINKYGLKYHQDTQHPWMFPSVRRYAPLPTERVQKRKRSSVSDDVDSFDAASDVELSGGEQSFPEISSLEDENDGNRNLSPLPSPDVEISLGAFQFLGMLK